MFLQIGLLTTMGLTSKNAILMNEFAERAEKEGKRVIDAAIEAARIRLRPILMTSFAFIFGVFPLAISTGPGANGRIAIGTAVIGGMLTATDPRDLLHSALLRPRPPGRARRNQDHPRALPPPARGHRHEARRRPPRAARDRLHDDGAEARPRRSGDPRLVAGRRVLISRKPKPAFRRSPTSRSSPIRGCRR